MTSRPIATEFPVHGCMDEFTTERGFDSKATWVIDVLGLFSWHVNHGCLYNQALADVQSTGAGIKCLYGMLYVSVTTSEMESGINNIYIITPISPMAICNNPFKEIKIIL